MATLSRKLRTKRWAISKHQLLALLGGTGLFIFGLSGLLHIVMVTWGPQQVVMMPPMAPLSLEIAKPLQKTLADAGIDKAAAIKVVAGPQGSVLQVTPSQMAARRYFSLETGAEIEGGDEAQAVFLARHYSGLDAPVKATTFLTDFTPNYPWVNRLLPVYRVDFETADNRSMYVYTETNASAGMTNDFKRAVQTGFRWFHTWDWLPRDVEWGRVLLIALFVGSLLGLAITGALMLITIRRKTPIRGSMRWHQMAGYALALPIMMFTSSGLYHLITSAATPPERVLSLQSSLDVAEMRFPLAQEWTAMTKGLPVSALSLVTSPTGSLLYRLGLAAPRGAAPLTPEALRDTRFEGRPMTGPAVYVDAETGQPWDGGDAAMAAHLGARFTGSDAEPEASLVTRFGPLYDFRNKRLPVWQLSYGEPVNATLWVDTDTGALVDKLPNSQQPERWSFSLIHKWNFLRPLGRNGQNIVIAAIVLASVGLMAGIGLNTYLKRRKRFSVDRPKAQQV